MQSMKEKAANVAASAKSGLEKTKATMEEKVVEKARSNDQMEKQIAKERKEERIHQAELNKLEARQHNAAAKQAGAEGGFTATGTGTYKATGTHSYSTTGERGQSTGAHQMSALPGHGSGQPAGQVVEGTAAAHPIGSNLGVGGAKSHNTRVEGNPHGYGSGGTTS
ncbi:hypothetical protein Goshw_010030 [Gossypium schwendimanii]|uniref:Uncharacterized protein n=2 Tax=Gossypium TaxID=3633 RepID=A0A7J9KR83_GOSSC|nr:hypothetical protein [Gossypium laxum]MBA0849013.1 hypothetical protein [Gossypium schwendimanii]